MAVPSKADIEKKRKALADHLKHLDDSGRLTEKKLVSMLRSSIRQVWMSAPNKLAKLEKARIPDMDPNTRTKWLFKCEHCGELFKGTDVEIDHKKGNHSFITIKDFPDFCEKILNAGEDDLQVLCIPDHEIKTLSEKLNITFNEARVEKEVIAKCKQKAAKQKEELLQFGFTEEQISNPEKRRKCYREYLNEQ